MFYDNPFDKSIMYVAPDGTGYRVSYRVEDSDDQRLATGEPEKLTDSEKQRYIDGATDYDVEESGRVDKGSISDDILKRLEEDLPKEVTP